MLALVKRVTQFVICLTACNMSHSKIHSVQAGRPFSLVSSGMRTWTAGSSSMLCCTIDSSYPCCLSVKMWSCRLWFLSAQWPGPTNMTKSPPRMPDGTCKDLISGRFSLRFVQANKGSMRPNQRDNQGWVWSGARPVHEGANLELFFCGPTWLQVIGNFGIGNKTMCWFVEEALMAEK